jgi:hypothetical protein
MAYLSPSSTLDQVAEDDAGYTRSAGRSDSSDNGHFQQSCMQQVEWEGYGLNAARTFAETKELLQSGMHQFGQERWNLASTGE